MQGGTETNPPFEKRTAGLTERSLKKETTKPAATLNKSIKLLKEKYLLNFPEEIG